MSIDYGALLNQAQGMYGQILGGFGQASQQHQANASNIMGGFNQLQDQVLGGLAGMGQARSQEIADQYTALAGREMQGLIGRGLGNTTVQNAVGRGLAFDQSKSQNQLSEQVAGMTAGYQSQLGLAGLGYQDIANQQHMAMLGQQLGYQAGWQGNLLGAALSGQQQQDQFRQQERMMRLGAMAGPVAPIRSGGGGGGGQPQPYFYGGGGGGGATQGPARAFGDDPFVSMGGGMGGGMSGMGEPIVHPGNFSAASLVGDVLGSGLAGGGMGGLGGLGAMTGGDWWDDWGDSIQWSDDYSGADW